MVSAISSYMAVVTVVAVVADDKIGIQRRTCLVHASNVLIQNIELLIGLSDELGCTLGAEGEGE